MSDLFKLPGLGVPNLASLRIPEIKIPDHVSNPAKWTHDQLVEYIREFEKELDDQHEVGARLVSFGAAVTFHIEDIGYSGPNLICFYGITDTGERVQLIQHFMQLSVLLMAMKKREEKPRRIGFDLGSDARGE
jgi:hypothetical protein